MAASGQVIAYVQPAPQEDPDLEGVWPILHASTPRTGSLCILAKIDRFDGDQHPHLRRDLDHRRLPRLQTPHVSATRSGTVTCGTCTRIRPPHGLSISIRHGEPGPGAGINSIKVGCDAVGRRVRSPAVDTRRFNAA
jgi:hypothetical protein